jgi:phosphate transport system substrate-binding protein
MKKIIEIMSLFLTSLPLIGCGTTQSTTHATFDGSKNITVYTRDATSGTRDAFFSGIGFPEAIADNLALVSSYVEVDGNGSMITAIQNDAYGIGYISLSSLPNSGLNGLIYEGVEATEANVLNGTYGLMRPFNYIIRTDWTGRTAEQQIVEAFVAYMSTIDGKSTIKNKGGIVEISAADLFWDDIKSQFPICLQDNSAITVSFGGSTSVESIAKALTAEFSGKCGNFIAEHNHTGSGDAFKRTQGTEASGANALDIGFLSRDLKATEPGTEGSFGLICSDAVVIVVNGSNDSIMAISQADIKKVFQGIFLLWNDLA